MTAMGFVSRFVREQRRYTKHELRELFCFSEEEANSFIRRLKAYGVLKTVRNTPHQAELSELVDSDYEITDEDSEYASCLYVFSYVGVLTVGNRIIKCYPKYISTNPKPEAELKQVLKVLHHYGSKEQIVNLYNGDGESSSFNLLSVMLYLLEDYHQYGLYTNSEDIVELNGEGPILWEQTINKGFAIFRDRRPYYVDFYTQRTIDNERDFIFRLHKSILAECSQQLDEAGLLTLFEIVPAGLDAEPITELGDNDYILYQIQSELNIQFNTHKQVLLKTFYAYIAHQRTLSESYGISMYGTSHFEWVWQAACAQAFGNKLGIQLRNLPLPSRDTAPYPPTTRLIDIIERPKWSGYRLDGVSYDKYASETLEPDLVNIYEQDGVTTFVIFDAKYYCLVLAEDKALRNNPGVGDVTKQYLYQLAYKDFLASHKISDVRNCFLLPTEQDKVVCLGNVSMNMLDSLGLQRLQIRQVPAKEIYRCYLGRTELPLDYLMLE